LGTSFEVWGQDLAAEEGFDAAGFEKGNLFGVAHTGC
jgi:hypothetical protein